MTTETRCEMSDLPTNQCAHCRPKVRKVPASPGRLRSTTVCFEARWGGRCNACDGGIREGDLICYRDDEIEHWECS